MTGKLGAGSVPLFTISRKYYIANCGDVRDKIYGLQSLAPACCREAIQVDYKSSADALYGRILEHHISSHDQSKVLSEIFSYSKELHKRLKYVPPPQIALDDLISSVTNPRNLTGFTVQGFRLQSIATSTNAISNMNLDKRLWLPQDLLNLSGIDSRGTHQLNALALCSPN